MSEKYDPENKELISTEVVVGEKLAEKFIEDARHNGATVLKTEKVEGGVKIKYTPKRK